ncbi:MAG TPA: ABC transporter permease [Gammaproteobacteria bacterium]|nr:ABC transporter permease [Gammaproteobacteria bacterium]
MLFKLAFRNIFRQRRRSLLTGLSMTGGFVLCTFSFSITQGSYGNAIEFFTLDHTGHIQIHWEDYEQRPKIYKTIADRDAVESILEKSDEVKAYAPRVFAPALAYAGNQTSPVSVIGIDAELEPTTSRIKQKVRSGEYFNEALTRNGFAKAMIGAGVANRLNIGLGDEIVLISQGADGSIANDIFEVVALVGTKDSYDRSSVYLPLVAAQEFISVGDQVHEYAMLVDHANSSEVIAASLQLQLDGVTPGATVSPWQVVEEAFYKSMQADLQGNYFAMAIIVFLVCIGVLNTVLMSVLERTKEFGVLRAIGSRPAQVFKLIFVETMLMATLSIALGYLLLIPLLTFLTQVGFVLPEPMEMGGVPFLHLKGGVNALVLTAPALIIYAFAALVTILPGIRAVSITPKTAMSSH